MTQHKEVLFSDNAQWIELSSKAVKSVQQKTEANVEVTIGSFDFLS